MKWREKFMFSNAMNLWSLTSLWCLNETEIGLGLTGFGVFFSFLGIIFFFDKGLIAMGNVRGHTIYYSGFYFHMLLPCSCRWPIIVLLNQILFFSGVALTIGLKSSMQFFMKRSNYKVNTSLLMFFSSLFPSIYHSTSPSPHIGWIFVTSSCFSFYILFIYLFNSFRNLLVHLALLFIV